MRYTVISGVDGGIVGVDWGGRRVPAKGVSERLARKACRDFRPPAHAQDRGPIVYEADSVGGARVFFDD